MEKVQLFFRRNKNITQIALASLPMTDFQNCYKMDCAAINYQIVSYQACCIFNCRSKDCFVVPPRNDGMLLIL